MMNDTIAAIATAYGESGVGIIRISGNRALDVLKKIFVSKTGAFIENRKMIYGNIRNPETKEFVDEVMVVYMQAPFTYTTEDTVEINCHGSMVILRKVLALAIQHGARMAEPGEFTKRAFLNGRLDLTQSEGILDLIHAKTEKGCEIAMNQMEGKISAKINEISKKVLNVLTNMAVNLDYPDEDIEEVSNDQLLEQLTQIDDLIVKLLNTADTGRILREGLNVAIVGKPNVGKSSLLNALLRETRAIVTEIPGTTRDTIEEVISIKGIPVKLIDTAGIRHTEDKIEQIGIERSKDSMNRADFIIFVLDGSHDLSEEDKEIMEYVDDHKAMVLINKIDLEKQMDTDFVKKMLPKANIIETSILKEQGIDLVEEAIVDVVYGGKVKQEESLMISNLRQIELLRNAKETLDQAVTMTRDNAPLDMIESELRSTYESLGKITGDAASDDIVNEVFANFCLGK